MGLAAANHDGANKVNGVKISTEKVQAGYVLLLLLLLPLMLLMCVSHDVCRVLYIVCKGTCVWVTAVHMATCVCACACACYVFYV